MAKKTKYPESFENKSSLVKSGLVTVGSYSTTPQTVITIKGQVNDPNIIYDLLCAIDEVLKFHGK